jgi:hypothetical protein
MIKSCEDLVVFLLSFHRSWSSSPGVRPSSVPDDLPDALAEVYRNLGALIALEPTPENGCRIPFGTQDMLAPLQELKRIGDMVEFAWENQGCWSCRNPLGPGDPPVYSDANAFRSILNAI